ncbi:Tn3 family transposase [Fluoribacter gormanii]|uniref:Tn3 family transposase n=1 Tax=Fluoribacter gormanii TaxID=464 RepID=UPI003BF784BE
MFLEGDCNIVLEPLVQHHIQAVTRHRISWFSQNYIRSEKMVRANAILVNHRSTIPLPEKLEGSDLVDGRRFVTLSLTPSKIVWL